MQYGAVWLVDFEYHQPDGDPVVKVHCVCARELKSRREIRMWNPEGQPCPYDTGPDSLFVAYAASAELSCHRKLGWPLPRCILDLYAEFRHRVCGILLDDHCRLQDAMEHFGLPFTDAAEKQGWQMLCAESKTIPDERRAGLLDYCMTDVEAAEKLLGAMLPKIDYPRCLIRGRYAGAVMDVEQNGLPVDTAYLNEFKSRWDGVRTGLVERLGHGMFVNVEIDRQKFSAYLGEIGLLHSWPRTPTGLLQIDDESLKDVARINPILHDIHQLRSTMQGCKNLDLPIGSDGRVRCAVRPYRTKTGRNAPRATDFIFAKSGWFRHFLKPGPEEALASLDYSAQEFAIAAALSKDERMLEAYNSGDPYLATAIQMGMAPAAATRQSHGDKRALVKPVVLGVLYGQGEWGIARRTGVDESRARELLGLLHKTYPKFFRWRQNVIDSAMLNNQATTALNWIVRVPSGISANPRSLSNHPVQGTGADILRVASILAVERGVHLGAMVHDSLVAVGARDEIQGSVEVCREAMREAGRQILGIDLRCDLGGMVLDSDLDHPMPKRAVLWPGRYWDADGLALWRLIRQLCSPE